MLYTDVVIVANSRFFLLLRCVEGILKNSVLPKRLIIIHSKPPRECVTKKQIAALCKKTGVTLIYKHVPQYGISYKRGLGVTYVRSDIFAYIDDDEIPPTDWIKKGSMFLEKHTDVTVVFGPKLPNIPNNYWNNVWRLITRLDQKSCFGSFATSSNGFYRTGFIKTHHIDYDREFAESSEDRVFSHKIIKAGGTIYYLRNLVTYHDFRTTFIGFSQQWFEYGYTMCLFNQKYREMKKVTSHLRELWFLLQGLRSDTKITRFTFGLFWCDATFALGYIKRLFELYRSKKISLHSL